MAAPFMAAALNAHHPDGGAHDDLSISPQTSISHPDFSLGSFASNVSTPHRSNAHGAYLRGPSTATRATTAGSSVGPITPSASSSGGYGSKATPGRTKLASRLSVGDYASLLHDEDEGGADLSSSGGVRDVLDTPAAGDGPAKKGRARSGTLTASSATTATKVSKLTLRDQEKHIDNLKKENFSIKLRVHFLEDQLARLAPDQMEAALKQNINLKIEVQQRGMEIKKLKKLVLSLEHELERLQRLPVASSSSSSRERELEERLEERERELRELRRRRLESEDDDLREAEARNGELEEELDNVKGLLEENMDEIQRLNGLVERKTGDRDRDLENENHDLRNKVDEQEDLIGRLQDDRDDLADTLNELQLRLEDLEQRRHAESLERSASRAALLTEQEEREDLEDEVNRLRDRVAALMIELQSKEDEVDRARGEIEELLEGHKSIVETVEEEWRGEVEEAHTQNEELKDVLAERDNECRELRISVAEFEANQNELHARYEGALNQLEEELEERTRELQEKEEEGARKEAEIEELRATIDRLGEQIYVLEDENDRVKEEVERAREEEGAEMERLEGVVAALKEKNAHLKDQIQDLQDAYDEAHTALTHHRTKQEELAAHVEALVASLEDERTQRSQAQAEISKLSADLLSSTNQAKRMLEAKDAELKSAIGDLKRTHALLADREADLAELSAMVQDKEKERRELGESVTSEKFGLQMEVDRLKRDLERAEDDVSRLRAELASRESVVREKDAALDRVHQENRDLATQLAAAVQARLNLSEKLDATLKAMKEKESEVGVLKGRLGDVEGRVGKDQRALVSAEGVWRDQLTERNTLLLTIYQYLDKILGVDRTPKKGTQGETKPFTNFSVFHDNLITRLKSLSQIQLDFDKRAREIETKFTDKMGEMRRQMEGRWKQVDKFESSVKAIGEQKGVWRRKLAGKEGELEAAKAYNTELSTQLSLLKRPHTNEASEIRSLVARATNAERRLNNAQNQLAASEEKLAAVNARSGAVDEKWEARVREYESRLRSAEERVKRERQGGKERVGELEATVKNLQRQVEMAQKRSGLIGDVLETNKVATAGSSSSPNR